MILSLCERCKDLYQEMDWSYTEMEWTSFYTMQGLDLDTEQIIVLITQQANTWSLR